MAGADSKEWSEKALSAVLSLWDYSRNQAWRGSQEHRARQIKGATGQLRPTATFNAILAFGECGLFLDDAHFKDAIIEVPPLHLHISGAKEALDAEKIFSSVLATSNWVDSALTLSEHGTPATATRTLAPRASMMLGRLVPAIFVLAQSVSFSEIAKSGDNLIAGLARIRSCLVDDLFADPQLLFDDPSFSKPASVSPQIVTHAAIAARGWCALKEYLMQRELKLTDSERTDYLASLGSAKPLRERINAAIGDDASKEIDKLLSLFSAYFSRQVDRQMARRQVSLDPDYDIAALAYAIHGWSLVNDDVRSTPFFKSCVAAIVAGQNPDGCWPEGMTVASHETSDVGPVRQPSVEIAHSLSETVFRRSSLFRCLPFERELLELALPSLKRQLSFLAASFQKLDGGYTGWADDRLRAPGEVRMIINATAARLIHQIRLAETAYERAKILDGYAPEWPETEASAHELQPEARWEKTIEPDSVLTPCKVLRDHFITPIAEQSRRGSYFLRPDKDGVSFIIYGPPGSGKTYVISQFAQSLGWPLINLSPGHFIAEGLESIEAVAGRIFGDLMRVDHAIVFFDECDELFRDRDVNELAARNILSFATASMLPKLQRLHDARKVIFVLGTNYVRKVDKAIRRPGRFDAILLFDRPDYHARLAIGKTAIAKKRNLEVPNLDPKDVSAAETVARDTDGCMAKEVISCAITAISGKAPSIPSTSDYSDWCSEDGEEELKAAGVGDTERSSVLARWAPHMKRP